MAGVKDCLVIITWYTKVTVDGRGEEGRRLWLDHIQSILVSGLNVEGKLHVFDLFASSVTLSGTGSSFWRSNMALMAGLSLRQIILLVTDWSPIDTFTSLFAPHLPLSLPPPPNVTCFTFYLFDKIMLLGSIEKKSITSTRGTERWHFCQSPFLFLIQNIPSMSILLKVYPINAVSMQPCILTITFDCGHFS